MNEGDDDDDDDEHTDWQDLDTEHRAAAVALGWDEEMWQASQHDETAVPSTFEKAWHALSTREREAAVVMEYDAEGVQWEEERGGADEAPEEGEGEAKGAQNGAVTAAEGADADEHAPAHGDDDDDDEHTDWQDLDTKRRAAAVALGYEEKMWQASQHDETAVPSTFEKGWYTLSTREREAAAMMGYDEIKKQKRMLGAAMCKQLWCVPLWRSSIP